MLIILQEINLNYAAGRGCGGGGGGYSAGRGDGGGGGDRDGRGKGNRNRNRRTPENENFARHIMDQYYSTHGGCNHASRDFTKKVANHNDEGTMDNRLGGSNPFCSPNQA